MFARSRLSTIFLLILATLCQFACGQQLCSDPAYPKLYNGHCYANCKTDYESCDPNNPRLCYSKQCGVGDCTTKTSCDTCSRPAYYAPKDKDLCDHFLVFAACGFCAGGPRILFPVYEGNPPTCACREDALSYTAASYIPSSICPTGTDLNCSPCPAGSYSIKGRGCTLCASGTYSSSIGSSDPNTCQRCDAGFISDGGAAACTRCGSGKPETHWTTDASHTVCKCQALYSGADCDVEECEAVLNDVSLLSLLLAADATLTGFSKGYDSSDSDKMLNADIYVRNLFKVFLDVNGDGQIRRPELIAALKARSMSSSAFDRSSLWYAISTIITTVPYLFYRCDDAVGSAAKCYSEIPSPLNILREYIDVDEAIERALQSHRTSFYHTFDGSGDPFIQSMVSSFPDPTWGKDAATPNADGDYCQRQDFNYVSSPAVHRAGDTVCPLHLLHAQVRIYQYSSGADAIVHALQAMRDVK